MGFTQANSSPGRHHAPGRKILQEMTVVAWVSLTGKPRRGAFHASRASNLWQARFVVCVSPASAPSSREKNHKIYRDLEGERYAYIHLARGLIRLSTCRANTGSSPNTEMAGLLTVSASSAQGGGRVRWFSGTRAPAEIVMEDRTTASYLLETESKIQHNTGTQSIQPIAQPAGHQSPSAAPAAPAVSVSSWSC